METPDVEETPGRGDPRCRGPLVERPPMSETPDVESPGGETPPLPWRIMASRR